MLGWHHRLNGREFQQAPGDGEGQGSLAFCSPWGHKESNTTEQLNNKKMVCSSRPLQERMLTLNSESPQISTLLCDQRQVT